MLLMLFNQSTRKIVVIEKWLPVFVTDVFLHADINLVF